MTNILQRLAKQGDLLLAGAVFGLLIVLLVPLPSFILDLLLATSVGLGLVLFLLTFYVTKPVEFSVFPTVLLVVTMFRLALNVASTRLILLHGSEGTHAAGNIIQAFGAVVVGGNYAVGLVVFVILVVINFVVISKGAGRVAEVAARFTLDAMPGKQMAIDAELNAGLIDEHTARARRREITQEADFYGAMDGASKFIRGDAIAGILITLINIIGGVFIGVIQNGMSLSDAVRNYSLLTIGDGLVGQVPALIVSAAAGMLVTRVQDSTERDLHQQIGAQLFQSPRVLSLSALALLGFGFIPGLRVPFITLAAVLGGLAWVLNNRPAKAEAREAAGPVTPTEATPEDLLPVESLAIEVGLDLLYLVDERQGGELIARVQRIRNQFAQDLGIILPPVHLRDNLVLQGGEYVVQLRGEEIGRGTLRARQHMALDPGSATGPVRGLKTVDPVFGLPAYWILDADIMTAQRLGYTVVDVPTVLTTHLVELMHEVAHELFENAQLQHILERVSQAQPRLVDDLTPDPLSRQVILKVFRNLIREGISTRDAQSILEALSEQAGRTQDPDVLTEFVRQRLARHISRRFADEEGTIHYVALGADAENAVLRGLQSSGTGAPPKLVLEPDVARVLITRIREITEGWTGAGTPVVLAPPLARGTLRKVLERVMPRVVVLSSAELLPSIQLNRIGTVNLSPQRPSSR
ncbi:MAG: flagellar biosynthesis protein FlhA [Deltaproteobacteria bacterium]|nr:flagellar biosynthesis protein FlhA [Deltaproteobacteria bacterium]